MVCDRTLGFFIPLFMSHADLMELLDAFAKKFPPAPSEMGASLKLTTTEIIQALLEFHPGVSLEEANMYSILKERGYKYEPIEENEHITFYWLVKTL